MQPDLAVGVARQLGQDALRLAQRVAEHHRGLALGGVGAPPLADLARSLRGQAASDTPAARKWLR